MKQSQINRHTGSKFSRLVLTLSLIGIGSGILILGYQYIAWNKITHQHNRMSHAETRAVEALEKLSHEREGLFQYLKSHLQENTETATIPSRSPSILENHISSLAKNFAEFETSSVESQAAIEQMTKPIAELYTLHTKLGKHQSRFVELKSKLIDESAKIHKQLDTVSSTVARIEGKQRLKDSILARKYKNSSKENLQAYAENYLNNQTNILYIRTFKSELGLLKVLVERLIGETQVDQLISLKDNELRQVFARLRSAAAQMDSQYKSESAQEIRNLEDTLFGEDAIDDPSHQTLTLGKNGLFQLKQNYFYEKNLDSNLANQVSILLSACVLAEQDLHSALISATLTNAALATKTLHSTWSNTLYFGIIVAIGFCVLAFHTAKQGNYAEQELNTINAELSNAMTYAKQATKSKSEFLANMSHEIRTPMTAIIGFAETLYSIGDIKLAPVERIDAIDTIKRNGEHLLTIINDILDISKIESGKLDVEQIKCSPISLVSDVHSLMSVRAAAKGIEFKIVFENSIPETIISDPTRLRQVLINIVGNAIKFTETGSVKIVSSFIESTDSQEPMMQFDVVDTGIGLTPEQSAKLFKAFAQADSSTTRKFGGTGLGLDISKRLAKMLGGDITIISEPDKGSIFRIQISTGSLEGVKLLDNPEAAALAKHSEPAATKPARVKIDSNVLLAEDGPDNQKLIGFILKRAGITLTIVENGKLAVDAALEAKNQGCPFDVILMDMQMPILDGYSATAQLRMKKYTGPIIALTAHAMESDRDKCIRSGCTDFATKPIDQPKLIALIDQYTNPKTNQKAA